MTVKTGTAGSFSDTPIFWPTLAVGIAAALFIGVIHQFNSDNYGLYADDLQVYFMPLFQEVARLIKLGEWPFITDHLWNGGAILGEYQVAIFNPVNLLMILGLSYIDDLAVGGAVYIIFHYAIYASGIYFLCRKLGCDNGAALVGTATAASSLWLLFWGATWIPALTSLAWVPWTLALLCAVYANQRWFWLGGLATAMPILSGWPLTTLLMGMGLGLMMFITALSFFKCQLTNKNQTSFTKRNPAAAYLLAIPVGRSWPLLIVCLCMISGFFLSMPALLPAWHYMKDTARDPLTNAIFATPIDALIGLGVPTLSLDWEKAGIYAPLNFAYVAWFAPILLLNAFWRRKNNTSPSPIFFWLCLGAVLLGLLSCLPKIWQFRWNFRTLPFWHLAIGLLCAWLSRKGQVENWRKIAPVIGLGLPYFLALCIAPKDWQNSGLFFIFAAAFTAAALTLQKNGKSTNLVLILGQLFFIYQIMFCLEMHTNAEWPSPRTVANHNINYGNELALYPRNPGELASSYKHDENYFWSNVMYGNFGLHYGRTVINGYSPILHKPYIDIFCFNFIASSCLELPARLFEIDPHTNLAFIDALKITRVTAMNDEYAPRFQTAAAKTWAPVSTAEHFTVFSRATSPPPLPGSISWTAQPADLALLSQSPSHETYHFESHDNGKGNEVLFARAWYPGMAATLDGKNLSLTAYRDLMPMVMLPSGAKGELTLSYWPKGLNSGLYFALIGMGLCVFLSRRLVKTFSDGIVSPEYRST